MLAQADMKKIKTELSAAESLFQELLKFYCIDTNKEEVTPQKFFTLWTPFIQSFRHYWESEQSIAARKKLASMKAERLMSVQVRPLTANGLVRNMNKNSYIFTIH